MWKKAKAALGVILASAMLFTAAAGQAETFEGCGKGRNDDIVVSVNYEDGVIKGIGIVSQKETPGLADPAFEKIPAQIVEHQSLDVDAISACTLTSNGLIEAITDALIKAGADVEALKAKEIDVVAGDPIEKTCDVLVVGAGGAGAAAAAAAAQNGAKVILIEKTAAMGGNTLQSGGAWNAVDLELANAHDTIKGQIAMLEKILDYDESEFGDFAPTLVILKGKIREYLQGDTSKMFDAVELHMIQTYTGGKRQDNEGNWITGDFGKIKTMCEESLNTLNWLHDSFGVEFQPYLTEPSGAMWLRGHAGVDQTQYFNYPVQYVTEHGGELMLETKAEHLIVENNRVVGVQATKSDGTPVTIRAEKGVILTTGGYAQNTEMLAKYNKYWPDLKSDMQSTNVISATGDGITMGLEVGASLTGMEFFQISISQEPMTIKQENLIYVNCDGKRFVNEYTERDLRAFAVLGTEEGYAWFVYDHDSARTGNQMLTDEQLDEKVAKGLIYRSDTIEGLAEYIGCDPAVLRETVDTYNAYNEAGVDEEFGRTIFGNKIENGPFFTYPAIPKSHHTMGGLRTNSDAQVLDEDGNVIEGLYAAGEVTGGIHGGNRLGGNAVADCFVFGKIAGEKVATQK